MLNLLGIAVGNGGLWLGAPPNLLFVPDRNHDDKPDGPIEIRLTGWGIQDRHEVFNSFSWGPDGWLYGCQGFATRSTVGKPADGGIGCQPEWFYKGNGHAAVAPGAALVAPGFAEDGGEEPEVALAPPLISPLCCRILRDGSTVYPTYVRLPLTRA